MISSILPTACLLIPGACSILWLAYRVLTGQPYDNWDTVGDPAIVTTIGFLLYCVAQTVLGLWSKHWKAFDGVARLSGCEDDTAVVVKVEYEYVVNGKTRRGTCVGFGSTSQRDLMQSLCINPKTLVDGESVQHLPVFAHEKFSGLSTLTKGLSTRDLVYYVVVTPAFLMGGLCLIWAVMAVQQSG